MDVFQILTCSMILVHDCLSFNVDFEHAVTFSGPQNSLFGYNSVLQSNRFVVTAPKGNQSSNPDLISPGTIYRCPVNFDNQNGPSCEQVSIRTSDLPRFQNNQFLGGSVVKINDGTVVCAHLAKYPRNDIQFQIVSGRCHLIDISLSRVDPNKVYNSVFSGMAGFSGAAVKNGSYSVLGAPGLENEGRGGFVTELWLGSDTAKKTFMAKDFSNINTFLHQSYIGYSIGIGQFPQLGTCVKSPILLGSPRFASVEGHVGSVILICETSSSVVILKQYFGDQIGSGFGYSISACDYNGDNIDDLIVAAPFFEENKESTDGGRVYVFRGTGDRDYLEATNATLKVDIVASGRFGTAMACLGDINADQLNDLAISAPYDGEGVIYIFNGKKDMINTVYSQKIYGRNVDPGIRTFGLHVSQQLADVDDNKYRDFTVGSALSNKLTLLRSRPVVSITPLVTLQHTMIPLNSSGEGCEDPLSITPCTTMTLCFSFREHLDGKVGVVDVSYQINVDVDRVKSRRQSRVHIVQNSTVYRNTFVNQNYILRKRQTHCESVLLRVTSFDRHFFASLEVPLKIEMNYSLNEVSRGMEILPILNPASDTTVERTVRFQTGCEGHCIPDLMIDTQMEPAVIVYGESEYLEYTITLTNSGEPALAPSITVVTPHRSPFVAQRTDLQAGSVRVSCQQLPDNITVNCECGNVLYINQLAKFSLIYDVSADSILPDGMNITDITDIVISATAAATGGVDANQDDNSVRSVVPVQLHSDVRPTGNSVPDQAIISDDRILLSLEHKYEILNIGPSPMIGASILVQLPSYMDGQVIMDYNSVRVTPNINTTDCEIIFRNRSNSEIPPPTNSPTASPAPFVLVDIDVTCNLDCVSVQCRVHNVDVAEFSSISISFDIYAQQLNFEGASSLNYISKGFISPVTTDLPFRLLNNGSLEVTSVLYPQKTKEIVEPLNLWIIVGGSLGGVALLVILFAVMWKVGFFKRDKKKVIEEYKRKSNFYENRKTQRLEAARSKALSKVMSRSDEIILHEK